MEGVMFATLFILFLLMGMETYGRLRNRDARFFRWLRKPKPLSSTAPRGQRGAEAIPNLHRHVDFNPKGDYRRYSIHIVINHFVMMFAFTVSVVTGLPLFFHNAEWAHTAVRLMGGIDMTRLIHRISAFVFTFDCLYHVVVLLFGTVSKLARGTFDIRRTQVPRWKDVKDLYFDFRYFLGLEKQPSENGEVHVQAEAALPGDGVGVQCFDSVRVLPAVS